MFALFLSTQLCEKVKEVFNIFFFFYYPSVLYLFLLLWVRKKWLYVNFFHGMLLCGTFETFKKTLNRLQQCKVIVFRLCYFMAYLCPQRGSNVTD